MVERFELDFHGLYGEDAYMAKAETGEFVRYSDYAALEAENERLRNMLNGYGKLDAELAIAERRIEALSRTGVVKVDELAQEIRRVDGGNSLGAGALAEALMPFLSTLEPAAPEGEPRAMTGFFSNLSPEGQAAALAYDGPEPNIGDTAPEGQQEAVAHAYVVNGECEQIEWGTDVDLPDDPALVLLYTRPSKQAVTEEMVEVAAKAVVAEWKKMVEETSPYMSPGDHARAFVSPGNYRLIRAALKAALNKET